jgi:glycosyltransferase involved in cell wall biosynthesis
MDSSVTVVTVTYNAEDLLEKTINSVLSQTYENVEYIIIDGGSTDGTVDILKQYDGRIGYWASEPDEGIYHAMNKAIERASGEFINFMNAGDTFADDETVQYVMEHKTEQAELIYGDYIRLDPYRSCKAQDQSRWYSAVPFCHQTLFTKTQLIKEEMFDTRYSIAADHDFVIKMYEQKRDFQYLERNLAIYEGGGISQQEPLIACVESLYILLHSSASEDEVYESWWYKLLKKNMAKDAANEIAEYRAALRDLSSIKFLYHPVRKIQKYKKVLEVYHSLKKR